MTRAQLAQLEAIIADRDALISNLLTRFQRIADIATDEDSSAVDIAQQAYFELTELGMLDR